MRRHLFGIAIVLAASVAGLGAQQAAVSKAKTKASPGAPMVNGDALRSLSGPTAIDGRPSTLVGCAGGNFYTTHALGASTAGTRIRVDVQSGDGIDPVLTAAILQMGAPAPDGQARMSYVFDDDSGGNLDPRLEFTLQYDANVVLSIGSFSGGFGCYWIKVEVTP
jgi:hypothetical protein